MLHAAPRTCYLSPSLPSSLNSPPPVLSLTRSHIVSLPPSQPGRGAVTGSGCIVGAEAGTRRTCHVEPCCTMACPRRCDAETACVSVWMLPQRSAQTSAAVRCGRGGDGKWVRFCACPMYSPPQMQLLTLYCIWHARPEQQSPPGAPERVLADVGVRTGARVRVYWARRALALGCCVRFVQARSPHHVALYA